MDARWNHGLNPKTQYIQIGNFSIFSIIFKHVKKNTTVYLNKNGKNTVLEKSTIVISQ